MLKQYQFTKSVATWHRSLVELTAVVRSCVAKTKLSNGVVVACAMSGSCALILSEPYGAAGTAAWLRENNSATNMARCVSVPFAGGKLMLGAIKPFLVELDGKRHRRQLYVTVLGE